METHEDQGFTSPGKGMIGREYVELMGVIPGFLREGLCARSSRAAKAINEFHELDILRPIQKQPDSEIDTDHADRLAKAREFAQAICNVCSIRPDCLNYGIVNNHYPGIYGGRTREQRIKLAIKSDVPLVKSQRLRAKKKSLTNQSAA